MKPYSPLKKITMLTKKQANLISKKISKKLVKFSFLAKGNHNENYLFKTDKGKYVLRIERNPMFKNLKKEYRLLKSLENLDVGPKVFLLDTSYKIIQTDYFLEEFIPGKHPKRKVDDNFVKLMAIWFKKLHSYKTSKKPSCFKSGFFSLSCAIKPYYKNFKKYSFALEPKLLNEVDDLFNLSRKLCQKEDKIFLNSKRFSILHRDPSKDNILINKKEVMLIDWEFASVGLPEWELVYFLQSYKFENHHKKLFLKMYGYPNNKKSMKRLKILSLLNICGDIGYSIWRLGLLKNGEIKEDKKQRLSRLKQDIKTLKKILKELKWK